MGPHIRAALLCEGIHTDPDGAVSAVRLLDHLRFGPPATGEAREGTMVCVVIIDGGEAGGGLHRLRMRVRTPSGSEVGAHEMAVTVPEGPLPVTNVFLDVRFDGHEQGLHWLLFSLDDDAAVSRVPLDVAHRAEVEDVAG